MAVYLASVVVAVTISTPANAQQASKWPTTKFEVKTGAPTEARFYRQLRCGPGAKSSAEQKAHNDAAVSAALISSQLGAATSQEDLAKMFSDVAEEYERAGFRPPGQLSMTSDGQAYEIYLYRPQDSKMCPGMLSQGVPAAYLPSFRTQGAIGHIVVNIDTLRSREHDFFDAAHELFHAVQEQAGLPIRMTNPLVVEGMAEGVAAWMAWDRVLFACTGGADLCLSKKVDYSLRQSFLRLAKYEQSRELKNTKDNLKQESYKAASYYLFLIKEVISGNSSHPLSPIREMLNDGGLKNIRTPNQVYSFLDRSAKNGSGTRLPFYLLYPEFTASNAMWGKSLLQDEISERDWRKRIFSGCEVVKLSRKTPTAKVTARLAAFESVCLEVEGNGYSSKSKVEVIVTVRDIQNTNVLTALASLDRLHLGTSFLSAKTMAQPAIENTLDCHRLSVHRKPGQLLCTKKPYTVLQGVDVSKAQSIEEAIVDPAKGGQLFSEDRSKAVKAWGSVAQIPRGGRINNVYVLTDAGLDASIAPGETRSSFDGRAVGRELEITIGIKNAEVRTSEEGEAELASVEINKATLGTPVPIRGIRPASNNSGLGSLAFLHEQLGESMMDESMPEDIYAVYVTTQSETEGVDNEVGSTTFGIGLEQPILFGQTGKFTAGIIPGTVTIGMTGEGGMLMPDSFREPQGTITVNRFDDSMLSIELDIPYCRMANMDMQNGECRKIERLSGVADIPEGAAYDRDRQLISINTPGMEIYKQALEGVFTENNFAGPVTGQTSSSQPSTRSPSAGGAGNSSSSCNCSCDEFAQLEALAAEMELRAANSADEIPDMSGLNVGKMMCTFQCGEQYAQCETAE